MMCSVVKRLAVFLYSNGIISQRHCEALIRWAGVAA
jgi:hypothetical protein